VRLATLLLAACVARPVVSPPPRPTPVDQLRAEFAAADGHPRLIALFSPG
jgi:hypothetical protein